MNYITKYHNNDWGYITLCDLQLANAPETIEVEGETLHRKSEFHTSLISLKQLGPMINSADPEVAAKQLEAAFLEFFQTYQLNTYSLTGKYYLVTNGERKTVVALCQVPGVAELFVYLRQKFGLDFPEQPAHITLYTLQPEMGIGILSAEQLDQMGHKVMVPALDDLSQRTG